MIAEATLIADALNNLAGTIFVGLVIAGFLAS